MKLTEEQLREMIREDILMSEGFFDKIASFFTKNKDNEKYDEADEQAGTVLVKIRDQALAVVEDAQTNLLNLVEQLDEMSNQTVEGTSKYLPAMDDPKYADLQADFVGEIAEIADDIEQIIEAINSGLSSIGEATFELGGETFP